MKVSKGDIVAFGRPLFNFQQLLGHFPIDSRTELSYENLLRNRVAKATTYQKEMLAIVCASDFPVRLELVRSLTTEPAAADETVRELEELRLITLSSSGQSIEIYHSRAVQVIRDFVGSVDLLKMNQKFVHLLKHQSTNDSRLLGEQLCRCDRNDEAADVLFAAAVEARSKHAYEEAASLASEVIQLSDPSRLELHLKYQTFRADSLAAAGHCEMAGHYYAELSEQQDNIADQIEMKLKAVFQYLIDDRPEAQINEMNAVAKKVQLKFSASPVLAIWNTIFYRLMCSLTRRQTKRDTELNKQQRLVIRSVARALTLSNPLLAGSLSAKLTFLAKRHACDQDWLDALDFETIFAMAVDAGWPQNQIGKKQFEHHYARRLNSNVASERSITLLSRTIKKFAEEDITASLKLNELALDSLKSSTTEATWEIEILAAFRVWAFHWAGDFNRLDPLLENRLAYLGITDSQAAQNQRPTASLILERAPGHLQSQMLRQLSRDNTDAAGRLISRINTLGKANCFSGRMHQLMFSRHYYLMYTSNYLAALKNIQTQRKLNWEIGYDRIPIVTPQLACFEIAARTALMNCDSVRERSHRFALKKLRRGILKKKTQFRSAIASSIEAFFHYHDGSIAAGDDCARVAIEAFESTGFCTCSNLLRHSAGQIERTSQQERWKHEANLWIAEQGIAKPDLFCRIASPAFKVHSSAT